MPFLSLQLISISLLILLSVFERRLKKERKLYNTRLYDQTITTTTTTTILLVLAFFPVHRM